MSKAKNFFKAIFIILIIFLTLIIIILLYSFLNHKIKTNQELTYLKKYDLDQTIEIESLNIDNNIIFKEVEGPHAIYYYPTAELSQLINSFLPSN